MMTVTVANDGVFGGLLYLRRIEMDGQRSKFLVEWYAPERPRVGRLITHVEAAGVVQLLALAFNAIQKRMPPCS